MCKAINGNLIDGKGRCVHYGTEKDIVAIQFKCCNKFYACYQCHEENEGHEPQLWPKEEWGKEVIACGNCFETISIQTYQSVTHCPNCYCEFNPNCSKHYHLYFEENAMK